MYIYIYIHNIYIYIHTYIYIYIYIYIMLYIYICREREREREIFINIVRSLHGPPNSFQIVRDSRSKIRNLNQENSVKHMNPSLS